MAPTVRAVRIRGAMWLDTATGTRRRRDLLIDGGVIVSDDGRSARALDLGGATCLFGLWDCHAHPGEALYSEGGGEFVEDVATRTIRAGENLRVALESGITGVRCVEDAADVDLAYARAGVGAGFAGPRVLGAGRALRTTGGHGTFYPREHLQAPGMQVIDGADQALRLTRDP